MVAEKKFDEICIKILEKFPDAHLGKMMSAPGIQYKKKNFAFFWDSQMCFKLGYNYKVEAHGVKTWSYLNPFKSKPPMKAWYILSSHEMDYWEELTEVAFHLMKKQLD